MKKENVVGDYRKTYVKPQLGKVQLVMDALIKTTCKTGTAGGPITANCIPGQGCQYQQPS